MVLKVEQRAGTLLLTVDRPEVKNAINRELVMAFRQALAHAEGDPSIRAIVLASSNPAVFLSGGDLGELSAQPMDAAGANAVVDIGRELAVLESASLPVIAAVEGAVFGGGCELLMLCDLLVMAKSATLSFVHARMGLTPAWGGATRLIERIGAARASELLFTARPFTADEAWQAGLATRLVADGSALESALAVADELATRPREAIAAIKRSLIAVRTARRGAALEAEAEVFTQAWGSPPHRAVFAAIKSKKK
ncbi:MAG TPA: enoyl-CoA hydratase/isomerase family protein [Polyangiaceae bacterium]|jgi:enoyl-CoA hydratase|nr:enoyl-CoA hydratase/isomerase family protein [Polyangiaceae bacterium]